MAYHFLDSKLDRALVAYLISEGACNADECYPALRLLGKNLPNVTVHTTDLNIPDGDAFSGSRVADVDIAINQSPVAEAPADDTEATTTSIALRQQFNDLIGDVCDALNKYGQASDLLCDAINTAAAALAVGDPDNNSDLADFGIYGIEPRGESQGFTQDAIWQKTFRLRCHVAATSLV